MIRIVNLATILFSLLMLIITIILYKKKKMGFRTAWIWSSIFLLMGISTYLFDELKAFSTNVLQVQPIDLFVIGAIIILITLSFIQNEQIVHLQKDIENIVHEMAMEKGKKENKKGK